MKVGILDAPPTELGLADVAVPLPGADQVLVERGRPTCVIPTSVGDVMEPADLGHESFDEVEVAAGDPNDRVDQLKLNPTVGIGLNRPGVSGDSEL